MMTRSLAAALGVAAIASTALATPGIAGAAVLLSDNFNSDTQAIQWPGDSVFFSRHSMPETGSSATDLVGDNGAPGPCAGAGTNQCVDLNSTANDGSGPAGKLISVDKFAAGTYTVTFDLAGNQGSGPETTKIKLGTWSDEITLAAGAPWTTYTLTIDGDTKKEARLKFIELGASNAPGNLLDNVSLSNGPSADALDGAVPEPATWAIMLLGVGAIGATARRSRRARSLALA
jgi:hypothetical protein